MLLAPPDGAAVVADGAAVVAEGAAVLPDGAAVVFDDGAGVVAVEELLLLPHAPRMSKPTAAMPITERFMWFPLGVVECERCCRACRRAAPFHLDPPQRPQA
jgi:hypothetical protein